MKETNPSYMPNKYFLHLLIVAVIPVLLIWMWEVRRPDRKDMGKNNSGNPIQNQRNIQNKPCEGYKDCSYEVREYLEGAGWQLAGDVRYYGNGVHYAVGAKPMETGVKQIYYTMDCNCKPKDVKFK